MFVINPLIGWPAVAPMPVQSIILALVIMGIAILVQAVVFGPGHLYARPGVALTVGFGALFSGVYFLIAGRNLWALILAHGIWDSLGVTLIYLNGIPST